jgi:serine phosphatase RsbU (regulator of sigma subunit)
LVCVVYGIRRVGLEGWSVLPAVILWGIAQFTTEFQFLSIHLNWFPFGLQVTILDIGNILLVGVIAGLLVRRLLVTVRRQRLMELDVKQAQEVQRVILPEPIATLPGLAIESEYRPAREVGGDFFQIVPHPSNGSMLIVAGDVAGKGLQAGMLVALLVGAIRTSAHFDPDPLAVLKVLNQRLCGRSHAAATCLALRIAADGGAMLANAGHLPPYLNGQPVGIEGSLPLGMIEDAEFSVLQFRFTEGDHLLLMSDGIAEATDLNGNLFGFERVLDLIRNSPSAAAIATVAQNFGQEDDISVISIIRTAAYSSLSS